MTTALNWFPKTSRKERRERRGIAFDKLSDQIKNLKRNDRIPYRSLLIVKDASMYIQTNPTLTRLYKIMNYALRIMNSSTPNS